MRTMKMAEFVKWVIEDGPFNGCHLDGGCVQDKAVECGLLVETKYDPALHGECEYCEPGDTWFVFSDEFNAAVHKLGT
jgi:hypothetical protein